MIVARAWGCTPAQLRACTRAEFNEMVALLDELATAAENGKG